MRSSLAPPARAPGVARSSVPPVHRGSASAAFTLVELLVVIGVIALLVGILMPALAAARKQGLALKCLANVRGMETAQVMYAQANRGDLVAAADGSYDAQGSWIAALEPYAGHQLVRRCPADESPYFDAPLPGSSPPAFRTTSYGINNYVSPTHTVPGQLDVRKATQVRDTSAVIHFVELAETGSYAGADHIHVQDFALIGVPQATPGLMAKQMPIGRHGGKRGAGSGVLNYSFLDGHAEARAAESVYTDATKNQFDPTVAR